MTTTTSRYEALVSPEIVRDATGATRRIFRGVVYDHETHEAIDECRHEHGDDTEAGDCARQYIAHMPTIERRNHSYPAIELLTGAECVSVEALTTGTGEGRVGLFIQRLDGEEMFMSLPPGDANTLGLNILEAGAMAKGFQREILGHDR